MSTLTHLPALSLAATGDQQIDLQNLTGKNLVLYFYPKDNTPGCSQEGQDFRDQFAEFSAKNTRILGVSRDTVRSHENFKKKYHFPFDLLADTDEKLCAAFDIVQPKMMFGKQVRGIVRTTLLFDDKGQLQKTWTKVKVKNHVSEVLAAIDAL